MTPLDLYVLVFSPIVVAALVVVPIVLARRDVRKSAQDPSYATAAWHAGQNRRPAV